MKMMEEVQMAEFDEEESPTPSESEEYSESSVRSPVATVRMSDAQDARLKQRRSGLPDLRPPRKSKIQRAYAVLHNAGDMLVSSGLFL